MPQLILLKLQQGLIGDLEVEWDELYVTVRVGEIAWPDVICERATSQGDI